MNTIMLKNNDPNESEIRNYKVYCYINKINNKKYIGLTSLSIKERAGKNGNNYKSGDGAFGIKRDENYKNKFRYGNNVISRRVICITTNTIFDSISRACETYKINHHANLSRACKNGTS